MPDQVRHDDAKTFYENVRRVFLQKEEVSYGEKRFYKSMACYFDSGIFINRNRYNGRRRSSKHTQRI